MTRIAGAETAPPITARVLGHVEIALGAREIRDTDWPRRTARSLLLLLLVTPGHALSRDQILDALWPDAAPDSARNALYLALHALRRVLEPGLTGGRQSAYIEAATDTIRIPPDPGCHVDIDHFELAVARLREANLEPRTLLRGAIDSYTGDLLTHEPAADWAVARRESLRQAWELAALDLADLDRAAGEPLATVPALERVLSGHPVQEDVHRALIRAYAAAGQIDQAHQQFARCVTVLREKLGIGPDHATLSLMASLPASAMPQRRLRRPPVPPTPLIGRDAETAQVNDLLWDPAVRLVTLTGPGGIGKTHLALTIANGLITDFADGALVISLAAVTDPDLLMATLAQAFDLRDDTRRPLRERFLEAIADRSLLLVLDTFETVLTAADLIPELLKAAPALKVLVTSRERLGVAGEHVLEIPPLTTYSLGRTPNATAVARTEAGALFAARARALQPSFAITDENAAAVAAICRRLDGIPLAIELAAARVREMAPAELLARLGDGGETGLHLLTEGPRDLPARLQTMRAAIAWSYDLLPPEEQALFRRLCVCAGGAFPELAGRVAVAAEPAVRNVGAGLTSLVDAHLIQRSTDLPPRYAMLETIRAFGAEILTTSGELDVVRQAFTGAMLDLADESRMAVPSSQPAILARLAVEQDNLRTALTQTLASDDGARAIRIAIGMSRFWRHQGSLTEGRDWLQRAIAITPEDDQDLRIDALTQLGGFARGQGDYAEAGDSLDNALKRARASGDSRRLAIVLVQRGFLAGFREDYGNAGALHREALALARDAGDPAAEADALHGLGLAAHEERKTEEATAHYEAALAIYRALNDDGATGRMLYNLGDIALFDDDLTRAADLTNESSAVFRRLGDRRLSAFALSNLGEIRIRQGDLAGGSASLHQTIGVARELGDRRLEAATLLRWGEALFEQGELAEAEERIVAGMERFETFGFQRGVIGALLRLGQIAIVQDQSDPAARRFGRALELLAADGAPPLLAVGLEGAGIVAGVRGAWQTAARLIGASGSLRTASDIAASALEQRLVADLRANIVAAIGDDARTVAEEDGTVAPLTEIVAEAISILSRDVA